MTTTQPAVRVPAGAGDEQWPPVAHFAWQAVVGPFEPSVSAMVDPRHYFGLAPEALLLYGNLRRDDDGEMYEVMRRIPSSERDRAISNLVLLSTLNDDHVLHIEAERGAASASSLRARVRTTDGGANWGPPVDATGRPWSVGMTNGGTMTWTEEGAFQLDGTLLPPGLQWYIPGPDLGMFYLSHMYEVHGTVDGHAVRGMIGFDRCYLPEGGVLYVRKDIIIGQALHNAWYIWATRYTDGSYEAGHFILANDRSGFAVITDEHQNVTLATDIAGTVRPGPGNWPERIEIDVNGQPWEFVPDPRGIMPDFQDSPKPLPTLQSEGRWRRVGDTREPEVWFAWGETAPAHGNSPTMRWRS